jgi:hypothetical protein
MVSDEFGRWYDVTAGAGVISLTFGGRGGN